MNPATAAVLGGWAVLCAAGITCLVLLAHGRWDLATAAGSVAFGGLAVLLAGMAGMTTRTTTPERNP